MTDEEYRNAVINTPEHTSEDPVVPQGTKKNYENVQMGIQDENGGFQITQLGYTHGELSPNPDKTGYTRVITYQLGKTYGGVLFTGLIQDVEGDCNFFDFGEGTGAYFDPERETLVLIEPNFLFLVKNEKGQVIEKWTFVQTDSLDEDGTQNWQPLKVDYNPNFRPVKADVSGKEYKAQENVPPKTKPQVINGNVVITGDLEVRGKQKSGLYLHYVVLTTSVNAIKPSTHIITGSNEKFTIETLYDYIKENTPAGIEVDGTRMTVGSNQITVYESITINAELNGGAKAIQVSTYSTAFQASVQNNQVRFQSTGGSSSPYVSSITDTVVKL